MDWGVVGAGVDCVVVLLEADGTTVLKKGRDRLPQPGMLTSHPVEIIRRSSNIAENMERLLKVSRNCSFLVSVVSTDVV
jgi:hypothetical protein